MALVWLVAAALFEAFSPSTLSMAGWVVGGVAFAIGLAFIRVVVSLAGHGIPVGLLAVLFIVGAIAIWALAHPLAGQIFLAVGTPVMALVLERARRQRQFAIAVDLAGTGFGDALNRRYGNEFAK